MSRRRHRSLRVTTAHRPTCALIACVVLACATGRAGRSGAPAPEVALRDGSAIEPGPRSSELAAKEADELFAIGTAAASSGDHALAAAAFSRLADAFPSAPSAAEAEYRAAESLYQLGITTEARRRLDRLAGRAELATKERARALTQRGVMELEDGEADRAEGSLEAALSMGEGYYPAKARFYLGEISRWRFEAVTLDPGGSDPSGVSARLEQKAQLLLDAQGRYLATIGAGDPSWAVAAGSRIGELYEDLHREILEAPLPPGVEGAAGDAYRAALRERVRVLVSKAIDAYQETLSAARRIDVDSAFVPRIEEALQRMQRVLAETEAPP